jgi:hypothetical protein
MQRRTRGERRALTLRCAKKRRKEHLRIGAHSSQCPCSPFYFRKRRPLGCHCRKRRSGVPRHGIGDKADLRARIYQWRKDTRELRDLLRRQCDPQDDAISRLCRDHHW